MRSAAVLQRAAHARLDDGSSGGGSGGSGTLPYRLIMRERHLQTSGEDLVKGGGAMQQKAQSQRRGSRSPGRAGTTLRDDSCAYMNVVAK
jgi:hypothetical protein